MARLGKVLWSRSFASAPFFLLAVACADQRRIDKPMAPDMTAIVSAYDAATAPLTSQNIDAIAKAAAERLDLLREIGVDGEILEALQAAVVGRDEAEATDVQSTTEPLGKKQQEVSIRNGYLHAVRICDGWGPRPVPNLRENGFILLLAGFTDVGFDPVVWGGFFRCRYLVGGLRVELRGFNENSYGAFRAFIGVDVPFDETGRGPTFYAFDLVSEIEDEVAPMVFDFKFDHSTTTIATRISVDDGYLITSAGQDLTGVRASNGDFVCTSSPESCTNGVETITY